MKLKRIFFVVVSRMLRKRVFPISKRGLALLTAVLLHYMTSSAFSQSTPLPPGEAEQLIEEIIIQLDERSKDVADEYLDILEKLQDLLDDYQDYLLDLPTQERKRHTVSLKVFTEALRNDVYIQQPDRLIDDIEKFSENVGSIEELHRTGGRISKCCALLRNLSRELETVAELADSHVRDKRRHQINNASIKEYLVAQLSKLRSRKPAEIYISQEMIDRITESVQEDAEVAEELARELGQKYKAHGTAAPRAHTAKETPGTPSPQIPLTPVGYGRTQVLNGTLAVSTVAKPVVVSMPAGNLNVSGWNEKYVSVNVQYVVSAQSLVKEKEYISKTKLKLLEHPDKYTVEVLGPDLLSHKTRLLQSSMAVRVPTGNRLDIRHANGTLEVSDLRNGLTVDAQNSAITVSRIRNDVRVTNSTGPITIADVEGKLTVSNSYKPVAVSGIDGPMEIANSYAEVLVSESNGALTLANSGNVSVTEHIGDVSVANTYGTVAIFDVSGNVTAHNAYGALSLQAVDGLATVGNAYSAISVEELAGGLIAINRHGPIHVAEVEGPLSINNDNGYVRVVVGQKSDGKSKIQCNSGIVDVIALEGTNMVVSASSHDGEIVSFKPMQLIERNGLRTGTLKLGSGRDSLVIVGSSGKIVIRKGEE